MKPDLRMVDVQNLNRGLFKRLKDVFDKPAIYPRGDDILFETRKPQNIGKVIVFKQQKYRVVAFLDKIVHRSTSKTYFVYLLEHVK
jgi:hypothetical protein